MDRIVASLSDYTAALTFEELPGEVVHHAKRMLSDTLGCAIAGRHRAGDSAGTSVTGCRASLE